MDAQDHRKNSASGHEGLGVHLCHKCNWPFPNPHPSAKHRRAHKKVCGKIEGYKIIASETWRLSDDEHLSDDDMRTPSPKMEKSIVKDVSGSDGTALKTSKSEDEVFSDAVTEFSDSWVTLSVEECRESVEQLDNNGGKQLLYDSIDDEQSKENGTDGPTKVLDNPTRDSDILNSEGVGYATTQPQNNEPASNIRVWEVSLGVDRIDVPGSSDGLVDSVVPEADRKTSATKTLEPILQEADRDMLHTATDSEITGQEKEPSGKLFAETRNMGFEPILSEADGNNFSTVGKSEQDKGLTDMLLVDATKNDLSSQNEPPINSDGIDTTGIKEDSAMDKIEHGHDKLAGDNDSKGEVDEEMHVVSVSESLQGVKHPELMTRNFKDYKVLKSSFPLDLCEAELTSSGDSDKKIAVGKSDGLVDSLVPEADRKTFATEILKPIVEEADRDMLHTATDSEITGQEKEPSGKLFAEPRSMNFEPILSEADGNNFSTVDKSEQDKGLTDMLLVDATKNDLSSQNEPPINSDGSDTTEIKEDSAMDKIEHGHDKLAEVNDSKGELDEEMHVVSVSESLQGVEHPVLMTQDFKDYKVLKSSSPLDLCDSELTSSGLSDKKIIVGKSDGLVDSVVPEAHRKTSATEILKPILQEADRDILHTATDSEITGQEKELSGKLFAETRNTDFEPILSEEGGNIFSTGGKSEQDKGLTDMLLVDATKNDLSSHNEPPINSDGNDTTGIKEDSAMDKIEHGHDKLAEVNDLKGEGDEEMHVVSVCESLQGVEHPELMTRDFKDYKVLKSSFPLDLCDAELTSSRESDKKITVSQTDSSYISSMHVGRLTISHSDINSLDNLEKGVLASIGREVDPSALELINEEDSGTKGFNTMNGPSNSSPEGFQPDSTDEKSSKYGVSALSAMAFSDVTPMSSIDEETTLTTKVETTKDNVIGRSDHVKTESGISNTLILQCKDEANAEASQGLETGNSDEIPWSERIPGAVSELCPRDQSISSDEQSKTANDIKAQRYTFDADSDLNPGDRSVVSDENLVDFMHKEVATLPVASAISNQRSADTEDRNARDSLASVPLVERLNVADSSVISRSRTESLEGNWVSVSVLSIQSEGTTLTDAAMLSTGIEAPEKSEVADVKPQTAIQGYHPNKSDAFEPPSFMTLVESGVKLDKAAAASELHTVQNTESQKAEALQAGWFPSITKVANESEGRKKDEEIISKVTSSRSGKQHSPLKNLLNEAYAETKAQTCNKADETASKNNGSAVTTVSSIMGSETPVHEAAKREMEKEWNLPARYPAEIKKEKKKGKPYWVPFVCCTSIQQDI